MLLHAYVFYQLKKSTKVVYIMRKKSSVTKKSRFFLTIYTTNDRSNNPIKVIPSGLVQPPSKKIVLNLIRPRDQVCHNLVEGISSLETEELRSFFYENIREHQEKSCSFNITEDSLSIVNNIFQISLAIPTQSQIILENIYR